MPCWNRASPTASCPADWAPETRLRLEAAMPLYGHELSETIDPYAAGVGWAVKLDKGDFVGREALASRSRTTTGPTRVGLELEGKRIARQGAGRVPARPRGRRR